jgi:hypothetical protein
MTALLGRGVWRRGQGTADREVGRYVAVRRLAVEVACGSLALVVLSGAFGGCSAAPQGAPAATVGERKTPAPALALPCPYSIDRCQLDVSLQPTTHRIEATAVLTVSLKERAKSAGAGLRLQLHRDLGIDSIEVDGKAVRFSRLPETAKGGAEGSGGTSAEPAPSATSKPAESGKPPAVYQVDWRPGQGRPGQLTIRYGGMLFQDVEAGEKPGEIHNLEMKAHVADEGIFLSEDGAWYPQLPSPDEKAEGPEIELTEFELMATEPPGMVLVASGNREGAKLNEPRGSRVTWRSPFGFQGMALVGGLHEVSQREVNGVLVSVHVGKEHAPLAPGLLDAVESYLKLYEPLIGKYPFVEFTVVENFFSSGFAYPGFTVLASAVIGMGPMGLEPGYLDHEMLHNWWGNGVFVSALDGNWCESLTSYCANYMRHVLEGRDQKARAMRRDLSYGLSRLAPEKDKPLGRFGHEDGPEGFIGYQKGSMVFAMLADRVGQGVMWRSLKRLAAQRLGKPTGWDDIRAVIEEEGKQPLKPFFDAWVRGSGVPEIRIEEAVYDARAKRLTLAVSQKSERAFDLTVPIRLSYEDGVDEMVRVDRPQQACIIKMLRAPRHVELDPEFRVIRRVPLKDVMPTISCIGKLKSLVILRTDEDFEAYKAAVTQIEERYKEAVGTSVRYVQAGDATAEDFKQGHALILGKACLAPAAEELLKGRTLSIGDGFFTVNGKRYDKPTDEVLCCLRNEQDAGAVYCFYYGNKAAELKKARVITFYGGNSLVVFENGQAVYRQDFENVEQVTVEVEGE